MFARAKYLWLLVALLMPAIAHAQLVQDMPAPQANPVSPSNLVFSSSTTVGNLLTVECVARDSNGTQGPLPTLSGLATWTVQADSGTANDQRAIIWTGTVSSAGTTVVSSFPGVAPTAYKASCGMQEWQPMLTLDRAGATENSGNSITSPPLTIVHPVELVLILGGHNNSEAPTATPTAPWVALNGIIGSVPGYEPYYQITSAVGTYSASWTWPSGVDNGSAAISMFSLSSNGAQLSVTMQ